jgi:dihydrofolate reductase
VTTVISIEEALKAAGDVEEVMIIGGGTIYQACLPEANKLYVTHIDADIEGDTQFPQWDDSFKEIYSESYAADDKNAHDMRFVVLEK